MEKFRLYLILVVTGLEIITSLYTWRALRKLIRSEKGRKRTRYIMIGYSVLILATTLAFFLIRDLAAHTILRNYIASVYFIVLLCKLVFSVFILAEDMLAALSYFIRRIRGKAASKEAAKIPGTPISRADFIYQAGLAVTAIPFFSMIKGLTSGGYDYKIHEVDVHIANLPKSFDGFRIIQLSDIHSGSLANKDAVARGVKLVNEQKADIFFFTGDLVNDRSAEAQEYIDIFSGFKKREYGNYSILGNHDYGLYYQYWNNENEKLENMEEMYSIHKNLGWDLMRNEHDILTRNGERIALIGVENWGKSGRFPRVGDIDIASRGMSNVKSKILLSHDPSHWDAVIRPQHADIDLTLSGHTHGMQFGVENSLIKWSPVQYIYKQWAGLYREGQQQIYVNRGFGFIGYPGRVGIRPEITVLRLRSA